MDSTGWYSPIDRRMYPSIFAVRNSAVWKSWLFLCAKRLDESRHHVFYRIDAAAAAMVHQKIPDCDDPLNERFTPRQLFPALERSLSRGIPCDVFDGVLERDYRHETIEEAADTAGCDFPRPAAAPWLSR